MLFRGAPRGDGAMQQTGDAGASDEKNEKCDDTERCYEEANDPRGFALPKSTDGGELLHACVERIAGELREPTVEA